MKSLTRSFRTGIVLVALTQSAAFAQSAIPGTPIRFATGASSATLDGKLSGTRNGAHDYVLRASSGQTLTVSMTTRSTSTYFNVLKGDEPEALFNSEMADKPKWSGKLLASGEYRVRVYLNRAAARQGKSSSFTLHVGVQ